MRRFENMRKLMQVGWVEAHNHSTASPCTNLLGHINVMNNQLLGSQKHYFAPARPSSSGASIAKKRAGSLRRVGWPCALGRDAFVNQEVETAWPDLDLGPVLLKLV
jgi:hypothetical protein